MLNLQRELLFMLELKLVRAAELVPEQRSLQMQFFMRIRLLVKTVLFMPMPFWGRLDLGISQMHKV